VIVTAAIGAHNIPEGMAVATVLVQKGTSPARAVLWAIATSLPQPLLAVPSYIFVETFQVPPRSSWVSRPASFTSPALSTHTAAVHNDENENEPRHLVLPLTPHIPRRSPVSTLNLSPNTAALAVFTGAVAAGDGLRRRVHDLDGVR